MRKNRKIYFLDTGFRNACKGLVNLPHNPNEIGHLVENMTFNILKKVNSYLFRESMRFFFYRTYDGAEIDFVLKRGNEIFPNAVISSTTQGRPSPLKGEGEEDWIPAFGNNRRRNGPLYYISILTC